MIEICVNAPYFILMYNGKYALATLSKLIAILIEHTVADILVVKALYHISLLLSSSPEIPLHSPSLYVVKRHQNKKQKVEEKKHSMGYIISTICMLYTCIYWLQ